MRWSKSAWLKGAVKMPHKGPPGLTGKFSDPVVLPLQTSRDPDVA